MTTKQLEKIYQSACQAKGYEPNDGQFKIWKQVLGWFEEADLNAALASWFTDNVTFPMPAELKTLAGHALRQRQAKSATQRYLVVWICLKCNWLMSGYLAQGESADRFCRGKWGPLLPPNSPRIDGKRPEREYLSDGRICGAELYVSTDERP